MNKTLIVFLAALAVMTIYQEHLFSQRREELRALTQKTGAEELHIQQIRGQRDRILSALSATQAAIESTQYQNKYAAGNTELAGWLNRVNQLKQWLRGAPEKRIPELQYLNSNDWLSVTLDNTLNTEAKIRDALSKLRAIAKLKPQVVTNLNNALQSYGKANNGVPLSDPVQLRPFSNPQLPEDILRRYELVPEIAGKNDANGGATRDGLRMLGSGRIILQEKAPVDEDYDTWLIFTEKGGWATGGTSRLGTMVDQAMGAYAKANKDQPASAPEQLLPYFPAPVDQTKLKEYWEVSRR